MGGKTPKLSDRANVGRSTFYTHFADKEDLLLSGFDDLRRALREGRAQRERPLGFSLGLVEHAFERRRLFRALVGKKGGPPVQSRFLALLIDLIREDLVAVSNHPSVEPTVHYLAGAFMEMLIWCLDTRNDLTAATFDQLFHELSAPVLRRLTRA